MSKCTHTTSPCKSSHKYDVIIVGSGLSGSAIAKTLADAGKHVLIIEEGKSLSSHPGKHLRNQKRYQRHPDLFLEEILSQRKPLSPSLPGGATLIGYGGDGLVWFNNCPDPVPSIPECEAELSAAKKLLHVQILQKHALPFSNNPFFPRDLQPIPFSGWKTKENTLYFISSRDLIANHPNISVQTETKALYFKHDGKTISCIAVQDVSTGKQEEIAAHYFVGAAGVFHTPHLLYQSHILSPALGKYLHYHPILFSQITLQNSSSMPEPPLCIPPTKKTPWHTSFTKGLFPVPPGVELASSWEISSFAPMEILEKNHIDFAAFPLFHVELSEKDRKILQRMHEDHILMGHTIGEFSTSPYFLPAGDHAMGTFRMGIDPSTSVTNINGKVHGMSNLFLAGTGLIGTTLITNPTLPVIALAIKTAKSILTGT